LIGCFAGKPGLRGYFFGVSFVFLMIKRCRSSLLTGNVNFFSSINLPPSNAIADFASINSSSLFAAFQAKT